MKYVSRVPTYKAATLPKTPFGVTVIIDKAFSGIVATLPAGDGTTERCWEARHTKANRSNVNIAFHIFHKILTVFSKYHISICVR